MLSTRNNPEYKSSAEYEAATFLYEPFENHLSNVLTHFCFLIFPVIIFSSNFVIVFPVIIHNIRITGCVLEVQSQYQFKSYVNGYTDDSKVVYVMRYKQYLRNTPRHLYNSPVNKNNRLGHTTNNSLLCVMKSKLICYLIITLF